MRTPEESRRWLFHMIATALHRPGGVPSKVFDRAWDEAREHFETYDAEVELRLVDKIET